MELVRHRWYPHFRQSSDGSGFDPYACLGLPVEDALALLAALTNGGGHINSNGDEVAARAAMIKEAFREIASSLHSDAAHRARSRAVLDAYNWIPLQQRYDSVCTAVRLLADPLSTVRWLLDQPHAARYGRRKLLDAQRQAALLQRQRQAGDIQAARQHAVATSGKDTGPRLLVLLALYGDLRAAGVHTSAAPRPAIALAKRLPWLLDPSSSADGDTCPVTRARLGLTPAAPVCDATLPLQAAVESLHQQQGQEEDGDGMGHGGGAEQHLIVRGPLHRLDGCWDPCPGYPKQALVLYAFRGRLHCASVDEDGGAGARGGLRCPMRKHAVEGQEQWLEDFLRLPLSPNVTSRRVLGNLSANGQGQQSRSGKRDGAKQGVQRPGLQASSPPAATAALSQAQPTTARTAMTARRRATASRLGADRAAELQRTFQASLMREGQQQQQQQQQQGAAGGAAAADQTVAVQPAPPVVEHHGGPAEAAAGWGPALVTAGLGVALVVGGALWWQASQAQVHQQQRGWQGMVRRLVETAQLRVAATVVAVGWASKQGESVAGS